MPGSVKIKMIDDGDPKNESILLYASDGGVKTRQKCVNMA